MRLSIEALVIVCLGSLLPPLSTAYADECVTAPSDLVSWWPGDGNADDVFDGNPGTLLEGATFAPGKVDEGFSLDGIDDCVVVEDAANLNIRGDVTVDLWAKRLSLGDSHMIDNGAGGGPGGDVPAVFALKFDGQDRIQALFEEPSGNNVILTGPTVVDSDFHHYAYIRAGDTHRLLMDGVEVDSAAFTTGPGDTTGLPLTIGCFFDLHDPLPTSVSEFGGVIDEVEVFDRALSNSEIETIFNAGSSGKCKWQIFRDGFESGDTSAWSSTVP